MPTLFSIASATTLASSLLLNSYLPLLPPDIGADNYLDNITHSQIDEFTLSTPARLTPPQIQPLCYPAATCYQKHVPKNTSVVVARYNVPRSQIPQYYRDKRGAMAFDAATSLLSRSNPAFKWTLGIASNIVNTTIDTHNATLRSYYNNKSLRGMTVTMRTNWVASYPAVSFSFTPWK